MDKTTELEAVNTILRYDGKSPVNTLTGEATDYFQIARAALNEAVREVQSRGWFWNTEEDVQFSLNTDQEIVLPRNVISICVSEPGSTVPTLRGERIYDKKARSYQFSKALKGTMVVLLEFSEMPEQARRYCTLRGARQLLEQTKPDTLPQSLLESEARALSELLGYDADEGSYNLIPVQARLRPTLRHRY